MAKPREMNSKIFLSCWILILKYERRHYSDAEAGPPSTVVFYSTSGIKASGPGFEVAADYDSHLLLDSLLNSSVYDKRLDPRTKGGESSNDTRCHALSQLCKVSCIAPHI